MDLETSRSYSYTATHRKLYYANRYLSIAQPKKVLTVIHDKMDHSKTAFP
jgi:hypothetical protein